MPEGSMVAERVVRSASFLGEVAPAAGTATEPIDDFFFVV